MATGLKATLAVGLMYGINRLLNMSAMDEIFLNDNWDWSKEIILITGGSSGMGRLMAEEFAARKIKVVILDINPPKDALPPGVFFYQTDVTSTEAIRKSAEQLRKDVGEPTVLINNAGLGIGKSILTESEAEVRRTFEVNLMALFWVTREFLPYMVEHNHGHIVTMASLASFVVIAGSVDYSCSKAGALAFHEGLREELKHRYNARRIRTTVVHPFWVRTPLIPNLMASQGFSEPLVEPEEVVNAVVKQVLSGKSKQIIVPPRGAAVAGIRGFPIWLQEKIRESRKDLLRNTTF